MFEKINQDLKEAMRNKDVFKIGVLRMLVASLKNKKIDIKKDNLSDEDVLAVIKSEIKKRKDSIKSYKEGGREDLAQNEKKELEILQEYMPEQMSEEELSGIVKEVISDLGAQSPADFGKVMGAVMKRVGSGADGEAVKNIVQKILNA